MLLHYPYDKNVKVNEPRLLWQRIAIAGQIRDQAPTRRQNCKRIIEQGLYLDEQRCTECDGYGHATGTCNYFTRLMHLCGEANEAGKILREAHDILK